MRWVDELGLKAIHGVGGTWNTCQKNRNRRRQPQWSL